MCVRFFDGRPKAPSPSWKEMQVWKWIIEFVNLDLTKDNFIWTTPLISISVMKPRNPKKYNCS